MDEKIIKAYRMMFREYPDVVDVNQLCEMLGMGYKSVCRLVKSGKIKRLPDCRKIKVAKAEVIHYVLHNAHDDNP